MSALYGASLLQGIQPEEGIRLIGAFCACMQALPLITPHVWVRRDRLIRLRLGRGKRASDKRPPRLIDADSSYSPSHTLNVMQSRVVLLFITLVVLACLAVANAVPLYDEAAIKRELKQYKMRRRANPAAIRDDGWKPKPSKKWHEDVAVPTPA
ncbi:hypothetical protein BKA93DRAFT_526563 [Sparassis latifolia]